MSKLTHILLHGAILATLTIIPVIGFAEQGSSGVHVAKNVEVSQPLADSFRYGVWYGHPYYYRPYYYYYPYYYRYYYYSPYRHFHHYGR